MIVLTNKRYTLKCLAASLACGLLFACEAVTETIQNDPAASENKELVGKLSAGIRPVENRLIEGQSLEVSFYLNNGTDAAIEVLPWATPLEVNISADLFAVMKDDEALPYVGRVVKRKAATAEDYITLESGEQLETTLNLSQAYDVSAAGDYRIVLESLYLQNSKEALEVIIVDNTVAVTRQ